MNKIYFDFIRYSIGDASFDASHFYNMDWCEMYKFARKQSLLGIMYRGVERFGHYEAVDDTILLKLIGASRNIKYKNENLNIKVTEICHSFTSDGFSCCILKGQGNAYMYPDPYSRTSGDIDVWAFTRDDVSKNRSSRLAVLNYCNAHYHVHGSHYHHNEFSISGNINVEAHYIPMYLNNLLYNHRLQKWFRAMAAKGCMQKIKLPGVTETIFVPTPDFNVVYQLIHLFHHFFEEGVGMRQMMDYYFLLTSEGHCLCCNQSLLRRFGLLRFAGAVMWVLGETLGMKDDFMIVPANEKAGRNLLAEVIDGGNFGKYFMKYGKFSNKGIVKKYFLKIWRNMHFISEYPFEALSEPLFRTWHFFWRIWHSREI